MKANRFSEAQIITVLREAEMGKHAIEALCREYGISEATFTQRVPGWRNKYGGLEPSHVARLKELEKENVRLKKLLAERGLEVEMLKEINAKTW